MQCDKCHAEIEQGEEREHLGKMLCEDCYMDVLSPAKSCDPWAVHSAKKLEEYSGGEVILTPVQTEIVSILKETGGMERPALLDRLGGKLSETELDRELASLRHMEKTRAEKRGDKVYVRLW